MGYALVQPVASAYGFSESGITAIVLGIAITVLSNALAYLLIKALNLAPYFGRFLGGVIILTMSLLLSLSSNSLKRYRGMALFGVGELIVGGLDIIQNKEGITQPLLEPDPGCTGASG